MSQPWEADPAAALSRRMGRSPAELGTTGGRDGCPDVWELSNGDFAVIGRDLTAEYRAGLPQDVVVGEGERLVVVPRATLLSAKADLPDA
ncbi:hypothetical protein SAMN05216371_2261 [Streptomyces sp. TLI_053]|uniref:hypothetical protein n=1 Tax=Streptomyces sp. TLI_053 TaxID=1855352 RepID=UPI000879751E|nr:hypothetical protein [Streptomyces sp. TLI_053]SDT42837.1 hypothetical protein SAMN05216371_2261 [Streptomyces sp. TLI_053]